MNKLFLPAHNTIKGDDMRDKKNTKTSGKSKSTGAQNVKDCK